MDVSQLVAFLAPFLTPLLQRTEEAAADAGARFGKAAWERAVALWRRVGGRVQEHPAAREAAQDVAAAPDNASARGALAWQLEKLLAADAALRDEVARLWQEAVAAGVTVTTVTASGERSVAVGGDVHGRVVTGDTTTPPAGPAAP
jgi:hypothetical protein